MPCSICEGKLRLLPSLYPTFHCELCGTLVESNEYGDITKSVPHIISALVDANSNCLRDDSAQCVVYMTARRVANFRTQKRSK